LLHVEPFAIRNDAVIPALFQLFESLHGVFGLLGKDVDVANLGVESDNPRKRPRVDVLAVSLGVLFDKLVNQGLRSVPVAGFLRPQLWPTNNDAPTLTGRLNPVGLCVGTREELCDYRLHGVSFVCVLNRQRMPERVWHRVGGSRLSKSSRLRCVEMALRKLNQASGVAIPERGKSLLIPVADFQDANRVPGFVQLLVTCPGISEGVHIRSKADVVSIGGIHFPPPSVITTTYFPLRRAMATSGNVSDSITRVEATRSRLDWRMDSIMLRVRT
jgi:hypothetical protein